MSTRNRLVGEGQMKAADVVFSPFNFRRGNRGQNEVLLQLLAEIGWVEGVMVNQRTGRLVDGEKRVLLARQRDDGDVPVSFVDLDEAEERLVVATLDAITAQALPDEMKLSGLWEMVEEEVRGPLAGLLELAGLGELEIEEDEGMKREEVEEESEGGMVTMMFGPAVRVNVAKDVYVAWRHRLFEEVGFKERDITPVLRARLGLEDIEL